MRAPNEFLKYELLQPICSAIKRSAKIIGADLVFAAQLSLEGKHIHPLVLGGQMEQPEQNADGVLITGMKSAFAILTEELCEFGFVDDYGHGHGREDDIVKRGILFEEGDLVLEGDGTGIGRCWRREQACLCRRIKCGWFWGGQLGSTYAADGFVRWGTVFPVVDLA